MSSSHVFAFCVSDRSYRRTACSYRAGRNRPGRRHLGWLNLHGTPLSFMGFDHHRGYSSRLAAIGELVNDKLPKTPSRLAPGGLVPRILFRRIGRGFGGSGWRASALAGNCCRHRGLPGLARVAGYQVRMRVVKAWASRICTSR